MPPTLVTNDPSAVRAFARRQGDLVVKPLAEPVVWEGGGESVVYTRRLNSAELFDLSGVSSTAHLFQQWQDKAFEVRLTAVGDRVRPDGEWVVLEANCVGAWGWLADACGMPIAEAFADLVTKES